ncbi:MAG: hypothetical protein HY006_00145 [Candidatus Sungbacteria bacterium]|nr:hypothetical protein [Candidatus Sungbacteria bacterium]
MSYNAIPQSQTDIEPRHELPSHWFFKPEIPRDQKDLQFLANDEVRFQAVREEYEVDEKVDLRNEKTIAAFFGRINTAAGLQRFVDEMKTANKPLFKLFQLAALGQCVSEGLTIRANAGSTTTGAYGSLWDAYRGCMDRLSGHIGEAITGQLISRSGWQARYPNPVLDVLLGFDRIAYQPATRSLRVIQCKSDSRLKVPFAVVGPEKFNRISGILDQLFTESGKRGAQTSLELEKWKRSLVRLETSCNVLGKRYPGNNIGPLFVITAGLGSKAHQEASDKATGLLRNDFRGMIDFTGNTAIVSS